MAETVRVLVVDDHEVLADALTEVLNAQPDLEVVGTANDLATARALPGRHPVDVVLLDHRLPDGEGVAAIPELHELQPGAAIVMLTAMTADSGCSPRSRTARRVHLQTHGVGEVTAAVRSAAGVKSVISPDLLVRLPASGRRPSRPPRDRAHRPRARHPRPPRRGHVERCDRRRDGRQRPHRPQPPREHLGQAQGLPARGARSR